MTRKSKAINLRKQSKKLNVVILGILLLILAIVAVFITSNLLKDANVKSSMSRYLKSKYSEDFNIERPEHKNSGFGVNGIWVSRAHPASNPNLKFDIDCAYLNPSDCSDQYIAAIWSVQAGDELESIVKEIDANSNGYKADSVRAKIILSGDLVDSVNKQSKYKDNKIKDEGFLYRLVIDAPGDKQKASYIFKIVERLRQEGIYSIDVDVNRNNNSKIRCEVFFDKNKLGSSNDIESCIVNTGE